MIENVSIKTVAKGYANEHQIINVDVSIEHLIEDGMYFDRFSVDDVSTLYFGQNIQMGICRGFWHDKQRETGYGGMIYPCIMRDGSIQEIKGPWSSRPSVYAKYGFPASIEIDVNNTASHFFMVIPKAMILLEAFNLPYTIKSEVKFNEVTWELVSK